MRRKLFISYCHEDSSKVKKFAFLLSLHGFDIWMDEKNISRGDYYTTKILNGIHEADVYLLFLSKASLQSNWVDAEIDFALHEKIEKKRLTIIPTLLEDVDIPIALSNIDYLDARFSSTEAVNKLLQLYGNEYETESNDIVVSSIAFTISEETAVQIGSLNDSMTMDDLIEDRNRILSELRKKAYGILMNFVSADDFEFQSETPKFANGIYEETVAIKAGATTGSICEYITAEAVVFNPSMTKVDRLLQERLEVLDINSVTFGFSIPLNENETMHDIWKKCFRKIQDDYTIISYDTSDGVKIEIEKDFYLFIIISDEVVKIKLSTKYDSQFKNKMKNFSITELIKNLEDLRNLLN